MKQPLPGVCLPRFADRRRLRYAEHSVERLENVTRRMREDWDWRAREDAFFFAGFGRRGQSRDEFLGSAAEVLHALRGEFRRFRPGTDFRRLRALEIGCGPGRLMIPMSESFGWVTGVDVSGEMVSLAKQNLSGIENAEVLQNSGSDLTDIRDDSVDFCYSYAVFQHIPDKEVVWSYVREACRVLKVGGLLKCQFNGLLHGRPDSSFPPVKGWSIRAGVPSELVARRRDAEADTWSGASFCAEEIAEFAARHNLQLLAMDRLDTQYLWVAARKRPSEPRAAKRPPRRAEIVRVTDTFTADAVVPQSGRFASATAWALQLSEEADLNNLRISIDGELTAPCFVGKHVWKNPTQVNVYLPPGVRSGIVPVRLEMFGKPVSNTAPMRVIPPGPLVPRLLTVTDAVNLLSNISIESRAIKVKLEEADLGRPEVRQALRAEIDGRPVEKIDVFCLDPLPQLYELDLFVPRDVPPGPHRLTVRVGARQFPAVEIQVAV